MKTSPAAFVLIPLAAVLCGCGGGKEAGTASTGAEASVIRVDGSSTVFPIAEAVAEEFQLGQSGENESRSGCREPEEASRSSVAVKSTFRMPRDRYSLRKWRSAVQRVCFIELPVAFDAITVVVNPQNDWVKTLTIADLRKMWAAASQDTIKRWNQVRPEWPDAPLMLFGPGADSGTFDYFTEAVNGKTKASRGDFTASEDDNVLVQGVENNATHLATSATRTTHPTPNACVQSRSRASWRCSRSLDRNCLDGSLSAALEAPVHLCE